MTYKFFFSHKPLYGHHYRLTINFWKDKILIVHVNKDRILNIGFQYPIYWYNL